MSLRTRRGRRHRRRADHFYEVARPQGRVFKRGKVKTALSIESHPTMERISRLKSSWVGYGRRQGSKRNMPVSTCSMAGTARRPDPAVDLFEVI